MTRKAEVLFKDKMAGILEETASGGTRFVYGADWSAPIACSLPIIRREHEWAAGLHPFFEHLGPEGWLREQQARVAHIQEEDDFGLLLRYGLDCIGAVGVRPSGEVTFVEEIPEATASPGRTISGIQKKLLVVRTGKTYQPASSKGPAFYIAKFNSQNIPTLVRNEALSLRWLTALLGAKEVTAFQQGYVETLNETALIATRFDRSENGEKLRLEDFAQILNKPRGADYAGKYASSYEEAAEVIKAHSARPQIDLLHFYRRIIAFILIGNCDAHLKNFSLLETPTGLRLSPVYDVLNTALYDGYDQTLALEFVGKRTALDEITRSHLEEFARRIGLPERAVAQTFAEFKTKTRQIAGILQPPDAEGPDGFITKFGEIVSRACLRLLQN